MPYLTPQAKTGLDPDIEILSSKILTGGSLNYAITRLVILYVKRAGSLSYTILAEHGLAHLSAATYEFYRRALAPYEDKKAIENGDVYEELFR